MSTGLINPSTGPEERALKEWAQLETIVTRHADLSFRTRGWLFALLTGATAVLFTGQAKLSFGGFVGASSGLIVLFLVMELIQRVAQRRALGRIRRVEAALRGEIAYDGPRVSEELSARVSAREFLQALASHIVWIPYTMMVGLVAIIGLWSQR